MVAYRIGNWTNRTKSNLLGVIDCYRAAREFTIVNEKRIWVIKIEGWDKVVFCWKIELVAKFYFKIQICHAWNLVQECDSQKSANSFAWTV